MAYSYDPIFAQDPNNPNVVASNASITIFDPADPSKAPIAITDPTGVPLTNPVTVDARGMGSAFKHATLDRVGWFGAGFTGYFTSYEGMKTVAVDAKTAAQSAANDAATSAAEVVTTATVDGSGNLVLTKASGATVNAGAVKGAKGDTGATGAKGADGSNVLPTDTAIQQAINDTASATRGALNSTYAGKGVETSKLDKTEAANTYAPIVEIDARKYADLPAAVAAVNATGGRCILRIAPGAYTLSATLAFTVPYVHVLAPGAVITLANGVNAPMVTVADTATSFTWDGGTLDGNRANQTGTSHGIQFLDYLGALRPADRGGTSRLTIQNVLTDGINVGKGRVQIQFAENTSIRNYTRYGVYLGGTDCTFRDGAVGIGQTGIMIDGFANWVHHNGLYSATDAAVRISEKGRYSVVSLNSIDNNPGRGLAIEGVAADTMDAVIVNNTFRANSQAGAGTYSDIYINQARAVQLVGNQTVLQTDRLKTSYAVAFGTGVSDVHDIANAWEPLAHVSGILSDSSKVLTRNTAYAATDIILAQRVTGDTNNRFQITAAGLMQWGPGNAIPDVSFYRETANLMGTGQQLFAQRMQIRGTAGAGYIEYVTAQTASPSAPAAGGAREFWRLNGSSKMEKCVRLSSGTVSVIWTEP